LKLQEERGTNIQAKLEHLFERWARIIDWANYLVFEHRYKEKEYGIKWREEYSK